MNESTNSENISAESEKPAQVPIQMDEEIKFPPFPVSEPKDEDFDEDITLEERNFYKSKFKDLPTVVTHKLHCSACDRHLGSSLRNESRMRSHPMLRTLMCDSCHTFYNSGEFEKGDDGSELYCRWCGQGGQVYCCSNCPHVFCAKCIKRNLGNAMIKEIEDTDDWKCFKCNTKYLWDLRAVCWAAFRYNDLRNKLICETQDLKLKEAYQKEFEEDRSECCKNKQRRKEKKDEKKPKESSKAANVKPTSTIQVKKFASINVDDQIIKHDKKVPQKRSASPKNKNLFVKNPITLGPKMLTPIVMPPMPKKMRMVGPPSVVNPIRFSNDRKVVNTYPRIRPKLTPTPMIYNGLTYNSTPQYNNMLVSDNINLSLDSLTQGLDMSSVGNMTNANVPNDVVCTPDFPLEPLCEVVEDNNDDDVQCIGPVVNPKNPPPLIPRTPNPMSELATNNIIQMTENDVTVNSETGGLKFRVDPQTLSSNKMYRLPDGRVFAINANPNMPGGYSATIVAVTEDAILKLPPKGATYAAKLCSVGSPTLTPPPLKSSRTPGSRSNKSKRRSSAKNTRASKEMEPENTATREYDLNAPVEWYRYNLIDAVDALEYSLSRLNKLKQETTTAFLRTRTVNEMRQLHKRLERLLNTSTCRFNEIRENLNKELRQYVGKKTGGEKNTSEDDDDVEILNDDHDDPIFIDENSVESSVNEPQDIDLTVLGSSDHNDSSEKSVDKTDQILRSLCNNVSKATENDENISILPDLPSVTQILNDKVDYNRKQNDVETIDVDSKPSIESKKHQQAEDSAEIITVKDVKNETNNANPAKDTAEIITVQDVKCETENVNSAKDTAEVITALDYKSDSNNVNGDNESEDVEIKHLEEEKLDEEILKDDNTNQALSSVRKEDDQEMSEEMIKSLLCDGIEDKVPSEQESVMDVSA